MADDESKDPTISMEEGTQSGAAGDAAAATELLKDPKILEQLGSLESYIQAPPPEVKRRIKALKKLQFEQIGIEEKFYGELHELECKYQQMYQPLFDRRRDIISGVVEPSDEDCEWVEDTDDEEEEDVAKEQNLANDLKEKLALEGGTGEGTAAATTNAVDGNTTSNNATKLATAATDSKLPGIPHFWLAIFHQHDILSDFIHENDDPILEHLTDIRLHLHTEPTGFTLEFHFSPNKFFSNSILTKYYRLRLEPDEDNKLGYEGSEISKCTGCKIDWYEGQNVTVKYVKKKQKHKGRGTTRTVTKTVKTDSFFNFFDPPKVNEEEEGIDEETEEILSVDYDVAHFLRERVIPRAVLYFTGECSDDEDEDDEDDEDEEDDESEDEGDDDDNRIIDTKKKDGSGATEKPSECKQQ